MKKFCFHLALVLLGMITFSSVLMMCGLRINTSSSIPKGLYWMSKDIASKGQYIIFCPQNTKLFRNALNKGYLDVGFCEDRFKPLMKKIVAMEGDVVSSMPYGVIINNLLLPFSKPKLVDGLPQWRVFNYRLKQEEVLVMTDQNPWSFDGRYFGLIHKKQIQSVIKPIWTWSLLSSSI